MYKVGVLTGSNPVGQSVGGPSHARVAVSGLYEVPNVDEFLPGHLVAYSRTHPVLGRVVSDTSVLLEYPLHLPQSLNLGYEGTVPWDVGRIEEMVLEDGELGGVGYLVGLAVLLG